MSNQTVAKVRQAARAFIVLAMGACSLAMAQDKPVVFENARLITITGEEIERGTLVVQGGIIRAVGKSGAVAIPADAQRVDASGKCIMPGLVDTHSHIGGVGGADGSSPIQPDVRVLDSLNPFESGFRRAVAGGLTTLNVMPGSGHLLSGQTIYLKLRGRPGQPGNARRIDELFIHPASGSPSDAIDPCGGIKMANGTNSIGNAPFPGTRGKSVALVRERYIKAIEYKAAIEKAFKEGTPDKAPPRDIGLDALLEVLDGRRIVHHHTHRADDIMTVLRLQKEFGFRVVLHHVSEAGKVATELAQAQKETGGKLLGCSAIVVDAPGGKLEAAELSWSTGAVLDRAGVRVAFHTDDWITDSRLFLRSAAIAVRTGMPRASALRALTLSGAEMLDLQKRIGSLEVGKDADIIVLNGDPLSVYTKVEETWVEGVRVFDRSNPQDQLFAVGGIGAGQPTTPYLCCVGGAGQ